MTDLGPPLVTAEELDRLQADLRHGYRPDIQTCNRLIAAARASLTQDWRDAKLGKRIREMLESGADLEAVADALKHPNAPDGPPLQGDAQEEGKKEGGRG